MPQVAGQLCVKPQAMASLLTLNCCARPQLGALEDLGHARSFEFMHTKCVNCGAHWFNVFCVANGASGYERVSDADAEALLQAAAGPEQKSLLKAWADEHL